MSEVVLDTNGTAAMKLGIPAATLASWEKRGLLGAVLRDAAGRRLYTSGNIEAGRAYLERRRARSAA